MNATQAHRLSQLRRLVALIAICAAALVGIVIAPVLADRLDNDRMSHTGPPERACNTFEMLGCHQIRTISTTTTTAPDATVEVDGDSMTVTIHRTGEVDNTPTISYERCEEDEILVATDYAYSEYDIAEDGTVTPVGEYNTRYVCVVLDDFADNLSIDRLNSILQGR